MNCKTCGTTIPPEAAFCPECGTPVLPTDSNSSPGDIPVTNTNQDGSIAMTRNILGTIEQSKGFNFFSRFINAMEDSGFFRKPLYWLYMFFALLNILIPVYLLFMLISQDLLNRLGIGAFLIWVVFAFAGWMGFLLWWNRKDKIGLYYKKGDDFFAIPLFSHYIQTTGEWLGMTLAILGAGTSLIVWIFLKGDNFNGGLGFPLPLQNFGIAGVIVSPIIGFTIILITRVGAELYRTFAAIANNTRPGSAS